MNNIATATTTKTQTNMHSGVLSFFYTFVVAIAVVGQSLWVSLLFSILFTFSLNGRVGRVGDDDDDDGDDGGGEAK